MKTLILYFSYSNNTKKLVEKINEKFNFDIARIERTVAYSNDYDTCAYKEAKTEWEKRIYPEIKDIDADITVYDRILLFFPIWWYTFPMPIGTFAERLKNYAGEIVLFENSYTNDLQYVDNSLSDFKKLVGNVNVKQGLFNKSVKEHIEFIKGE